MPQTSATITLLVCVNRRLAHDRPSCAARGGEDIAAALEAGAAGTAITVTRLKCFGRCAEGPNVRIRGGRFFRGCTLEQVPEVLAEAQRLAGGGRAASD